MAERVGFEPTNPSHINTLGQVSIARIPRIARNLSIRYKTGTVKTACLRCLSRRASHGLLQVPVGLQMHPHLRRCLQETRQPERRVGGDAALAEDDLIEPIERDTEAA